MSEPTPNTQRPEHTSINDLVFILDENGICEGHHQLFGDDTPLSAYVPEEGCIGKRYQDVLPPAITDQISQAIRQAVRTQAVIYREHRDVLENRTCRFHIGVSLRRDQQGDYAGVTVIIRDITQQHEIENALRLAEQRYRDLFNDAPVMYVITRNQGGIPVIVDCNNLFLQKIGYSREAVINKPLVDFYTEASTVDVLEKGGYRRALKGTFIFEERQLLTRSGQVIETLLRAVPETNAAGVVQGTRAMYVDISKRKQAEQERERLIDKLEAKNAELERFTYTVSHDLKGPLVTIRGFLGLLKQDIADEAQMMDDIMHIREATLKMERLLDDLLKLSRIGQSMGSPAPVPLDSLVQEAIHLTFGRIAERGVVIDMSPDLPTVYGDRTRLLGVFQNLIENAAKFMGDQPRPRIEIGVLQDPTIYSNGNDIICYVSDNGIGIAPKNHDKVFELFKRLSGDHEGTGIGLALVKRIIESHGGRIWVESRGEACGSTFFFTLPSSDAPPIINSSVDADG